MYLSLLILLLEGGFLVYLLIRLIRRDIQAHRRYEAYRDYIMVYGSEEEKESLMIDEMEDLGLEIDINTRIKQLAVRVPFPPLPQSCALLTENGEKLPFSTYLISNELLDMPIERFLSSLRFQQRGKLDQLGIEIDSID